MTTKHLDLLNKYVGASFMKNEKIVNLRLLNNIYYCLSGLHEERESE